MKPLQAWACALLLALLMAAAGATGCGQDLVLPGDIPATDTPTPEGTPTCLQSGNACVNATDCCSGSCITNDGVDFFCQ